MIQYSKNNNWAKNVIISFLITLYITNPISAALHEQLSIDAKAISLSNTVTSSPPGIMSIHYNPAGLSRLKEGKQFTLTLTGMKFEISGKFESDPDFKGFVDGKYTNDPLNGSSGTTSDFRLRLPFKDEISMPDGITILPATFGFSYKAPDSRWTFANGFYSPYFLGFTHNNENDPFVYGGKSLYIQHIVYLSPTAAYEISDFFSAGVSIGFGQSYMGSVFTMRTPNELSNMTTDPSATGEYLDINIESPISDITPWFSGGLSPYDSLGTIKFKTRDDFTPSVNIGILWEPGNHFSFGMCYQGEVKSKMRGEYIISNSDEFINSVNWLGPSGILSLLKDSTILPETSTNAQKGFCSLEFTFPARLQTGITFRPFRHIKLMCDLHWTEGSSNKTLKINFDQDIQILQFLNILTGKENTKQLSIDLAMKDTIHFSYASEIMPFEWLTFRCGYEKRQSSADNNHYSLLVPIPDLDIYGTGLGIILKNGLQIDIAGSYSVNKGYKVPNNTSKQLNSENFEDILYNPYAGLNYEQDTDFYEIALTLSMPTYVLAGGIRSFLRNLNVFRAWG